MWRHFQEDVRHTFTLHQLFQLALQYSSFSVIIIIDLPTLSLAKQWHMLQ